MIDNIFKLADIFHKCATNETIFISSGKPLYHGTIKQFADKIIDEGFIRSDMWDMQNQQNKTSGGTLGELGLIWFSDKKIIAEDYASGRAVSKEKFKNVSDGKVFVFKPSRTLKLTDRGAKLSKEEAEKLQEANPRKYDEILPGDTIHSAENTFVQWEREPKGLKDILKILGYDGIIYNRYQYGILADKLPFDEYYSPPTDRESFKEESDLLAKEERERCE